jgi:PAS domain S-box-containing protein
MKDKDKTKEQLINELEEMRERIADKKTEGALRESERQYRNLFENIPTGVYRTTPDGRIVMANPSLVRMLGYSSFDELALRNLEIEGFDYNYSRSEFKEVLERDGEVRGIESAWKRHDSSVIFVRENARAIRGEDGTVLYYEGTVEDITEKKRAEGALQESLSRLSKKSRYETIISTVTRSVHRSINLQDVLGNAVEAISKNIDGVNNIFISLVEGEDAVIKAHRGYPEWFIERVSRIPYPKGATWKTIMEGKPTYCADVDKDDVIGPAGREVGTKSYLSMPIRLGDRTVGVMNINSLEKNAFDEEELKLLEIVAQQIETAINNARHAEALRQSEERYRTLFNQSPIGVCIIDRDLKITQCNEQMVQIFRSSYEKVIGLDLRKLKDQSFVPIVEKAFEGQVGRNETLYEATTSSAELWLSARAVPLRDADENVVGVMGVVEDITERKKMEEELLKVQKLESLGVLAGGIAHDFNNLLTVILGNVSLLKINTSPDDSNFKRLIEAEKACMRARDVTGQLITFSKGGTPVKKETSIEEIIRESAAFVLVRSNVRYEFSIPNPSTSSGQGLWSVEVDEKQIGQVMHNLLINADQSMPEGGVITVRAENVNEVGAGLKAARAKNGRYVKITVEDQGVGIAQEHLSKIFDPYFTTREKSSGLGLASVHSIIKNHDGYIGVESEIGVGTKFYIYLPAMEDKEMVGDEDQFMGVKGTVLVMDDELVVRDIFGEILNHLGYGVEFAKDGCEAIEIYEKAKDRGNPFDLVIMDLTIPGGMGGKEAIERLREIDPGIKAIVSSGYSNDPIMSEYRKYGFRGVISKPYKIEDLSEIVGRVTNEGE